MNDSLKIPILTYHALHAPGWEYETNDHVALEHDLELIKKLGFEVVSLMQIVEFLQQTKPWPDKPVVGLSFDDGTDHDYIDWSHPAYGYLKSCYTLLKEATTNDFKPVATSFVIASPQARIELDKNCIAGRNQWRDSWWLEAANSGVLDIANHSWDHTHESLEMVVNPDQIKGQFDHIDNIEAADLQIMQAEIYLSKKLGNKKNGLFAYPYGHYNEYLTNTYFPENSNIFKAAFITGGRYVESHTGLWEIPRFVCGENWSSPQQLEQILKDSIS